MALLTKITEALKLAPQAAYALYFDVFKADPDKQAQTARFAVRDSFFNERHPNVIQSASLTDWLVNVALVNVAKVSPTAVALPLNIANDGVGNALYFHALASMCAVLSPSYIVEFGTFLGMGTLTMAVNCNARILTIDLPDAPVDSHLDTLNQADLSLVKKSQNRTGYYYKGTAVEARITEVRCDSRQLDLRRHVPGPVGLCLVDGGHSLECVKADTENAFSVIQAGGIILWDDYFWMYPEVVDYLDDLSRKGRSLVRIKGTHLVVYVHP